MASRNLGSLTLDLILKLAGFEQGMDKAARLADKRTKEMQRAFTGAFKTIGGTIAGFVAGLATIDTAIRGFSQAIDVADRLDELSNRLGISTEQLSEWGYAAKLSGTDLESLASAIPKLSKNLAAAADAGSKQGQLFKALGIDVKDAAGNLRDVEDLIPEIADAFKTLNNDTLEAALAQELFGKSGAEMLEFLNRGSDGLKEFANEARSLGGVIDGETAAAAAAFKDEVDRLKVAINGVWTEIAAQLAPVLTDLVRDLKESAVAGDGVRKTAKDIADIASVLAGALRLVSGEFSKADEVGTSFRDTLSFLGQSFKDMQEMAASLFSLDVSGWFNAAGSAAGNAANAIRAALGLIEKPDFSNVSNGRLFNNVRGGSDSVSSRSSDTQDRLNRLLSDSGGSKKSGGKSEEQRQAEQLERAYESLMESMRERIALFGQEGEAAKVRYEIEQGSLKALDDAKKQALLTEAKRIDQMVQMAELQDAADRRAKEIQEIFSENRKRNADYLADLKFEIELLGMSNKERERAIALAYLTADATDEEKRAVLDLTDARLKMAEQARFWEDVERSMADAFYDFATGAKSAKDALGDFLDAIYSSAVKAASDYFSEAITNMFRGSGNQGTSGNGGGWGDFFSAIMGFFGGGKANGGWGAANTMFPVNERGIEMATVNGRDYLLTGNSPVKITPHERLGVGGVNISMTNNFDRNNSQATPEQIATRTGQRIQRELARTGR